MPTAIIYARISNDDKGDLLGVDRQERLCRELAERRGLDVVRVITDDDVSAYSRKPRPGFEDLLEAMKAGEADVVVVYNTDRLYRRLTDFERLIDVVEVTGTQVHTVAGGDFDLSTSNSQIMAGVLGAFARGESKKISERSKVKHDELAARGRAPGGRAPYGYRWETSINAAGKAETTYVQNDTEVAVVRTIADRVLKADRSCRSPAS